FHFRLDVSQELSIEITLRELQHLLQNIRRFCFVTIEREHAQDRVETVTLGDELTHLRRLEVCDRNVLWTLRPLKPGIDVRDLDPAFLRESTHEQRIPIVAPTGTRAPLFVNRE